MKPATGALPWDAAAPPFDPRDTTGRASLTPRQVVERFIQLFYVEDNSRDAFLCWMHPDYIQHNPNAPTGRDATLAMMEASMARNPELTHAAYSPGHQMPAGTTNAAHTDAALLQVIRSRCGYAEWAWGNSVPGKLAFGGANCRSRPNH